MVILTTFPPPEEGIHHKQDNTHAHVSGRDLGDGILYIAESRVSWVGKEGPGFSLEYPAISLHAISRDTSSFPHECLYLMIDSDLDQQFGANHQGNGQNNENGEDSEGSETTISEIRFVPTDSASLKDMYSAMCTCQALHPDEDDSISEEEGEEGDEEAGDYFEDPSGEAQLTESGQAILDRLEGVFDAGDAPAQIVDPPVGGSIAQETNGGTAAEDEPMETGQFEDVDQER